MSSWQGVSSQPTPAWATQQSPSTPSQPSAQKVWAVSTHCRSHASVQQNASNVHVQSATMAFSHEGVPVASQHGPGSLTPVSVAPDSALEPVAAGPVDVLERPDVESSPPERELEDASPDELSTLTAVLLPPSVLESPCVAIEVEPAVVSAPPLEPAASASLAVVGGGAVVGKPGRS